MYREDASQEADDSLLMNKKADDGDLSSSRPDKIGQSEKTQSLRTNQSFRQRIIRLLKGSVYILALLLIIALALYFRELSVMKQKSDFTEEPITLDEGQRIPKVLWLFTEFQLEGEGMLEQVMGNYLMHKAEQGGWQVRKVTSWTAYQYISQETQQKITNTMQNMFIQQKVNDLYRLALLMEHGGVMVRVDEVFPVESLSWLRNHFLLEGEQINGLKKNNNENNQVLLFEGSDIPGGDIFYQDFFLAATKKAKLIIDSFQEACQVVSSGNFTFSFVKDASYVNPQMNSIKVKRLTRNILHSWLKMSGPEYYHAQVIQLTSNPKPQQMEQLESNYTVNYLQRSISQYNEKFGVPRHLIYLPSEQYRNILQDELQRMIDMEALFAEKNSYWADLMSIPYNKKLYQVVQPRPVHYCIIDAHEYSNFSETKASFEALKEQSYIQWTAVYFSNQQIKDHQNHYMIAQKQQNFNIVLRKGSHSVGRNYQLGIIQLCPDKSFILVLKTHERLVQKNSLNNLVQTIQPRNSLGAFVTLNVSGQIKKNQNQFQDYHKSTHNGNTPQYENLQKILNHLRVFHSDCYKILPQFEIRTPQNQYFDDRFIFLENFIYMTKRSTEKCYQVELEHKQRVKWFIKASRHLFDVPFFIRFHDPPLIKTNIYEEINKTQLNYTFFRSNGFSMMSHVHHLVRNGQTMKQLAIFNPGHAYEPYTSRHKPQRIPKIIHQIWVGGQLPEGKRYLIEANKQLYPDWEYKLWRNENITRENFPLSYDLIQNVIKVNKFTKYSRMATVADIMRHQIMYREGGFYLDTSMKLFNNIFNQWLSYKVVIPTLEALRHRWIESMCLFGNQPKYPGLLRIISQYNTNRYNIYRQDAMQIAGPYDFIQYIQGYDEYDPDVLIMGFDKFYPMDYRIWYGYGESMCAVYSQLLHEGDEVVYRFDRISIVKNCGKYYPYSFGKEAGVVGGSTWQKPR